MEHYLQTTVGTEYPVGSERGGKDTLDDQACCAIHINAIVHLESCKLEFFMNEIH